MESRAFRDESINIALKLGYRINPFLPLLDVTGYTRTKAQILTRLLCLHVSAACAYGLKRNIATKWISTENIGKDLAESERNFIEHQAGDPNRFKVQIEAIWALAWVLEIINVLDFADNCDSNFVTMLPNLKILESSETLKMNVKLRSIDDVLRSCDLAYCLHWAIQQDALLNMEIKRNIQPYVVIERRRAFEWLLGKNDWDSIELDT